MAIKPGPIVLGETAGGGGGGGVTSVLAGTGLTGGGTGAVTVNAIANADGSIVANANDLQVGVLASDAQHGLRGGGTQHAAVIAAGAAGFMSGADKTKLDGLPTSAVAATRNLTAGAGMTGGGDLSADRTFDVVANADGSITVNANDVQVGILATDAQHGNRGGGALHADVVAAGASGFMTGTDKTKLDGLPTSAVSATRTLTAGAGLTGGGDLSADRTFDVGAGFGVSVAANNVAVDTAAAFTGANKWTGAHSFSDAVTLGDAAADDIAINGSITTDVVPKTDNINDLGTTAKRWKTVHVGPGSVVVHNDATDTTKASLGFSGGNAILTTTGAAELHLDSAETKVNGNITLGDAVTDDVTVTASINSNLLFKTGNGAFERNIVCRPSVTAGAVGDGMLIQSGSGGDGSGATAGGNTGTLIVSTPNAGAGTASAVGGDVGVLKLTTGVGGVSGGGSFPAGRSGGMQFQTASARNATSTSHHAIAANDISFAPGGGGSSAGAGSNSSVGGSISIGTGPGGDGNSTSAGSNAGVFEITTNTGGAGGTSGAGGSGGFFDVLTGVGGAAGSTTGAGGNSGAVRIRTGSGRAATATANASFAGDINVTGGAGGAGSSAISSRAGSDVLISGGVGGDNNGGGAGGGGGFYGNGGAGAAANGSSAASVGGLVNMGGNGGAGGSASASAAGAAGGLGLYTSGIGGTGSATAAGGPGGLFRIRSGNGGGDAGGGGASSGDLDIDTGSASGAATNGSIGIGESNSSAIRMGRAGVMTDHVAGAVKMRNGAAVAVSAGSTGNIRYNNTTVSFEASTSAENYATIPESKAAASDTQLTTTGATSVAAYTPAVAGNYLVNVYFRVITAVTTLDVTITWTDGTGAQSSTVVTGAQVVGSFPVAPTFINSTAAAITVTATAGTANQVFVSTAITRMS